MKKSKSKKRGKFPITPDTKPIPGLTKPEDRIDLKKIDKDIKNKREKATKTKEGLDSKITKVASKILQIVSQTDRRIQTKESRDEPQHFRNFPKKIQR